MGSKARTLAAAVGLGLGLLPALPASAQQQPAQGQAATYKFKDPALQQYLVGELTTIEEKLDKLATRIEAMEGQLAKLKEQQQALASDFRANQELSKATDTSVTSLRASNQEDLLSVKTDVARIRRDLSEMADEMRKASAPPAPPPASQPKLEGYITQAGATSISINLGSAAGVEVGMRFGVYRAAEPQTRIGTLEITEVLDANNSRAKIVASNPNTKFQFSDIVRPY
jgi:tetrahydromethanopterin S-methyltransferase subunit B